MVSTAEGLRMFQQGMQDVGGAMSGIAQRKTGRMAAEKIMEEDPIGFHGGEGGRAQAAAIASTGDIGGAQKLRSEEFGLEKFAVSLFKQGNIKAGMKIVDLLARISAAGATRYPNETGLQSAEQYKKTELQALDAEFNIPSEGAARDLALIKLGADPEKMEAYNRRTQDILTKIQPATRSVVKGQIDSGGSKGKEETAEDVLKGL